MPLVVVWSVAGLSSFFFFFSFIFKWVSFVSVVLDWELSARLGMDLSFSMVLDGLSCSFVMAVLYISVCVVLFSAFYMTHDSFFSRFICLLLSFVMSMVLLVLFPNFFSLLIGWDGLGIVSFLLVIYYFTSDCLSAGMITGLSNRVGDVFFVLSFALMSSTLSYSNFDSKVLGDCVESFIFVLSGLVVLGSMTKSAVVPFSAWLPEAMAAPTPVSSLVHSSTLVTAGVYVLIRFAELSVDFCNYFLMVFSLITMIVAGMAAISLVDVKKVVALSTLSQVSMMMLAISVGAVEIAYFHLLVHAFFKALMFMCVGSVIYYSGGVQDVRFLGGLWLKMPLVYVLLVTSNLCLVGFPFFSGYFSKELILSSCLANECSFAVVFMVYFSLVLTVGYSFRMLWLISVLESEVPFGFYSGENIFLNLSLMLMGIGAITVSIIVQELVLEMNTYGFLFSLGFYGHMAFASVWLVNLLTLVFTFKKEWEVKSFFLSFISSMWFLKPLSGEVLSVFFLDFFFKVMKIVDMGWIRGYIWKKGLKEVMDSSSNFFRLVNFRSIGFLLCCSAFIWFFVLFF